MNESLQKLQQLAAPGLYTIRPSMTRSGYWHIDGGRQQSIAVARDEATAAFIATACNQLRESANGCDE
jgi:hypothetical protein